MEAASSDVFVDFDKCRSKVAGDVISGVAAGEAGTDVRAAFVNLSQTAFELFGSLAGRTCFAHFCAVFNCIL